MQIKRKDRIISLRCSFMKPKLLVFAVVITILFIAIGASVSSAQDSSHKDIGGESSLAQVYEQWFQGMKKTTRPSFLVVPLLTKTAGGDASELFFLLVGFYKMYPEAKIPHEFPRSSEGEKSPAAGTSASMYSSILLTMAYQQGYQIETVTDSHVILVKSVNIETEERGDNNAEKNSSD